MAGKKRRLNREELGFAERGIRRLKEDIEFLKYQVDYHDLMIKSGLEINFKRKMQEFKDKRREFMDEMVFVDSKIEVVEDQIKNGVLIKEEKVKGGVKENGRNNENSN